MSATHTLQSAPQPEGIPFPEYYSLFMDWRFPIGVAALYTLGVVVLNPKSNKVSRVVAQSKGLKASQVAPKSGTAMTAFVFFHNLVLCVFSVITFLAMGPAMLMNFWNQEGFTNAYCDRDGSLWNNHLGYWGYLFYLSKFYEILDTIIILMKGRRSSLLQTYHHAGAMITMWSGINYSATAIWIFVVFNSFIHSIMYAYYAATSIGFHPPGKKYLTTMQISQFLIGGSLAISYLLIDDCHKTPGAKMANWINVGYLFPLTYLFVDFARRTYGGRKGGNRNIGKASKENGHFVKID